MEYILFLSREGNFQSRAILIPVEKLNSTRKAEFKQLKGFSEKIPKNNQVDLSENTKENTQENNQENKYLFKIKYKI